MKQGYLRNGLICLLTACMLAVLISCGVGDGGGAAAGGGATDGTTTPTSINLLVSNPQLNSDGVSSVTLTALVKDSGNRA
ncbi:MAG: hypothetical protein AABY92_06820, partial [Thermodesulfobacteriota bacterium]